jgi:hypothetical protein
MNLVFDFGFHQGNFARSVIKIFPGVKIIGVEGHPLYCKQFYENPIPSVTLIEGAVAGESLSQATFCIAREAGNSFLGTNLKQYLLFNAGQGAKEYLEALDNVVDSVTVQVTTPDHVIYAYGKPDFIKFSIEGSVYFALQALSQKIPLIAIECDDKGPGSICRTIMKECIKRLIELGYTELAFTANRTSLESNLEYIPISAKVIPEHGKGMFYIR